MGKVKGKHRLDKYYYLAKEQGYRSRAAFKLIQLDAKYSFLYTSRAVLDLCAAPGSWMQVIVNRVPVDSLVIGVDLNPIGPIHGAMSIEADITTPKCRAMIKNLLAEKGRKAFDLVLHDGSPNVGGAWAQEATYQSALVIDSVKLATEFLSPKGTFVTKVFRSQDYTAILYCLRQLFEKVEVTKPAASRITSAEIYVVGLKYKAPAKIDPRLLDFKHLFQGSIEPPKVLDVLRGTKQKRHRDGYEEGLSIVRKVTSAANFVRSDNYLEILGTMTSISFQDPDSLPLKDHPLTTEEVKASCDDLRVLGKQDFKNLLKWRVAIRKVLASSQEVLQTSMNFEDENKDKKDKKDEEDEEDEDEKTLNEMKELSQAMERKKKQQKKKMKKRHEKEKARKALGMQTDVMEDGVIDHELFSLASIKGKKQLATVDDTEDVDDEVELGRSSDEDTTKENEEKKANDLDSDEERERYDSDLEDFFEEEYERYLSRTEGSSKQRKRAKQSSKKGDLLEGGDDEDMMDADEDSDLEQDDNETNPLMVPIDKEREPTQEEITQQWFSQGIFSEALEQGDLVKGDDDEMHVDEAKPKASVPKKPTPKVKASKADDDFEIVPAPATDSSDSSSDEEYDDDSKAEILAYAKKMLRKKQRDQIIDDGYNKYMFDDEGLPKWFIEEEKRHRQPVKPVTKEEIAAMKAQFRDINARPVKKVAEAKARKKRVAMRKLEKVRKKANSIADQNEIPDRSKWRMIEQLYKKATPKKPKKEFVVAKKGVGVKVGKGKVLVDRRMKKDARQHGMSKQGKNGKNKEGKILKGKKGKGAPKASARKGKKGGRSV
ncbi:AdoMet-dependent rRNA methyltransferase spb1-like protein [Drosera capensis]